MPVLTLKIRPRKKDYELRIGGAQFLFFYIIVALASFNTGNNLLYLILAVLTSASLISWLLAFLQLNRVNAAYQLPDEIFARDETVLTFSIAKRAGITDARSLNVILKANGHPDLHIPFINVVHRNNEIKRKGLLQYPERGKFEIEGIFLSSSYPFGLIRKRRFFQQKTPILVFPELLALDEIIRIGKESLFHQDSPFIGQTGGIHNIRPFQAGDDRRHLHWKATARLGALMVKEFSRQEGNLIRLHFNSSTTQSLSAPDTLLFEIGVSVAASLAFYGREAGHHMVLSSPGLRLLHKPNDDGVLKFLQHLAVIKPKDNIREDLQDRRSDEFTIVIDPFYNDSKWDDDCTVLDRAFMEKLLEERS